jgi:hypothetical protein
MLVESRPEHEARSGLEAALLTQYLGMDGGGGGGCAMQERVGSHIHSTSSGKQAQLTCARETGGGGDACGPPQATAYTGPCTAELTVQLASRWSTCRLDWSFGWAVASLNAVAGRTFLPSPVHWVEWTECLGKTCLSPAVLIGWRHLPLHMKLPRSYPVRLWLGATSRGMRR